MEPTKHAGAPWRIDDMPLPASKHLAIRGDGEEVCRLYQNHRGKYYSIKQIPRDMRANAKLIASAPELLEACKLLVAIYGEDDTEAIDQAKQAIQKTES